MGVPYFFSKTAGGFLWRYHACSLFVHKQITASEVFRFCLPFKRGDVIGITHKAHKALNDKMKEMDMDYDAVQLTPEILLYPSERSVEGWHDLLYIFHQIVLCDQYRGKDNLVKGSVVIDAGANIGLFAVFAAMLGAKVYAFEPAKETLAVLEENVKALDVEVVPVGLGNVPTSQTLVVYPKGLGASMFVDSGIDPETALPGVAHHTQQAEITTIDAFVRKKGLTTVDFIKIDAEGYEAKILAGARDTIKKFRPVVAMSAYHHPEDITTLPGTLNEMTPYKCELRRDAELDFICKPL